MTKIKNLIIALIFLSFNNLPAFSLFDSDDEDSSRTSTSSKSSKNGSSEDEDRQSSEPSSPPRRYGKFFTVMQSPDHKNSISIIGGGGHVNLDHDAMIKEMSENIHFLNESMSKTLHITGGVPIKYYECDTFSFVNCHFDGVLLNKINEILTNYTHIKTIYFTKCHFNTLTARKEMKEKGQFKSKDLYVRGTCTEGKSNKRIKTKNKEGKFHSAVHPPVQPSPTFPGALMPFQQMPPAYTPAVGLTFPKPLFPFQQVPSPYPTPFPIQQTPTYSGTPTSFQQTPSYPIAHTPPALPTSTFPVAPFVQQVPSSYPTPSSIQQTPTYSGVPTPAQQIPSPYPTTYTPPVLPTSTFPGVPTSVQKSPTYPKEQISSKQSSTDEELIQWLDKTHL